MHYTIEKINNYLVITIDGEVDMDGVDVWRQDIDAAIENHGINLLVFDLGGVEFIDSSGLGVILGRYKKVAARGGQVFLAGAKPPVKKILELSGLLSCMESCPSTANLFGATS